MEDGMLEMSKDIQKASIMIVDDTPANLELLASALKGEGYRVRSAPSGKLAIQAVEIEPPDLILLDIMMPEMNGYEVCAFLKGNEKTRDIPVIFITALDKDFDEEKGLTMGAVDYITKPVRLPIVKSRVNTHLQLKLHRDQLERLVEERTGELEKANRELAVENVERRRAESQVRRSLEEKEVLLKEIHHRVKNNLQIISSMLSLQERFIQNDKDLALYVDSRNRIRAMALVHEKLYAADDFSRIHFADHIRRLVFELKQVFGIQQDSIIINEKVDDVFLDVATAIPCSQIVNELISNSIKHAFPGGSKGRIDVVFEIDNNNKCTLAVRDNGVGPPDGFSYPGSNSIGLGLVNAFVQQLNGTIEMKAEGGLEFIVSFINNRTAPG
jgi:two-component sensor histidine kinase/CheY-like chemotaxis protein